MMTPERKEELTRDLSAEDNEYLSSHANVMIPMDEWILSIVGKVVTTAIEKHAHDCPFRNQSDSISTKAMVKILGACGALAAAIAGAVVVILKAVGN